TKNGGYSKLPMVMPSIEKAAQECIARLRALGHARVDIFSPDRDVHPISTVAAAAKAKRMKVVRPVLSEAGFEVRARLKELMSGAQPPTVVVALQAEAARLQEAASALKIKVPADLSIVAIRDRSVPAPSLATASTIHLDPRPMGQL